MMMKQLSGIFSLLALALAPATAQQVCATLPEPCSADGKEDRQSAFAHDARGED